MCAKTQRPIHVDTEGGELQVEGLFKSPLKARLCRRRRRQFMGRRPVHVAVEGGNSRAEGPFNLGPKAHFPAGRRPIHIAAEGGE